MKNTNIIFLFLFAISCIIACQNDSDLAEVVYKSPELPEVPYDYGNEIGTFPANFIIHESAIPLGRVLFHDVALSRNNRISCESCHIQQLGFADGRALSKGLDNKLTTRNSPTIANLATSEHFFWDMSVNNIHELVVTPVQNHVEMGMENLDILVKKIESIDYYPSLFEQSYGTPIITQERIENAIASYLGSIVSNTTKFDKFRAGEAVLNPIEMHGVNLFIDNGCDNCHKLFQSSTGNNGSMYSSGGDDLANIGLDLIPEDEGVVNGRFKIPTLRNLAFTAPYMHDGRFETLEEVIEHYNSGVIQNLHLDSRLSTSLDLSEGDKYALKAFLLTLTDDAIVNNPKYANPFVY